MRLYIMWCILSAKHLNCINNFGQDYEIIWCNFLIHSLIWPNDTWIILSYLLIFAFSTMSVMTFKSYSITYLWQLHPVKQNHWKLYIFKKYRIFIFEFNDDTIHFILNKKLLFLAYFIIFIIFLILNHIAATYVNISYGSQQTHI